MQKSDRTSPMLALLAAAHLHREARLMAIPGRPRAKRLLLKGLHVRLGWAPVMLKQIPSRDGVIRMSVV